MIRQRIKQLVASTRGFNLTVACLSFTPFTRGLAMDLLALKTLRYGAFTSMQTLLWVLLTPAIFAALGHYHFAVFFILLSIIPVFLMALVLGTSNRWQLLVECLWLGLLIIWFVLRYLTPDTLYSIFFAPFELQWKLFYQQWLAQNGIAISLEEIRLLLPVGLCIYLFSNLSHIFIARAIQAWCFHQGGFLKEMQLFSLSSLPLMGFLVSLIGMALDWHDAGSLMFLSMMPLALLGLVKSGLRFRQLSKKVKLMAPLFVVAFIVGLPVTLYILVFIGILDILMKFGRFSYASHFTRKDS